MGFKPSPLLAESGMGEFFMLTRKCPHFPRNEQKAKLLTDHLKVAGVDGILTLRSIFENLLRQSSPAEEHF